MVPQMLQQTRFRIHDRLREGLHCPASNNSDRSVGKGDGRGWRNDVARPLREPLNQQQSRFLFLGSRQGPKLISKNR